MSTTPAKPNPGTESLKLTRLPAGAGKIGSGIILAHYDEWETEVVGEASSESEAEEMVRDHYARLNPETDMPTAHYELHVRSPRGRYVPALRWGF